jgi:hypothetical protein
MFGYIHAYIDAVVAIGVFVVGVVVVVRCVVSIGFAFQES